MPQESITISVQLPHARAMRIRELAQRAGVSTHRYVQRLLINYASREYPEELHVHFLPSEVPDKSMTETVVLVLPLEVGMRLHRVARLLRTTSEEAVPPAWLIRQIVMHFVHQKTDIMERINATDADYVDLVPFTGKTILRAGATWYQVPMKCTFDQKQALFNAAKQKGSTATGLARTILERALPRLAEAQ